MDNIYSLCVTLPWFPHAISLVVLDSLEPMADQHDLKTLNLVLGNILESASLPMLGYSSSSSNFLLFTKIFTVDLSRPYFQNWCFGIVKPLFTKMFTTDLIMVTSNSLDKGSSFRESSFVLTQANYQKLQRTVN